MPKQGAIRNGKVPTNHKVPRECCKLIAGIQSDGISDCQIPFEGGEPWAILDFEITMSPHGRRNFSKQRQPAQDDAAMGIKGI
jgi:hypothetical protein